MLFKKTQNQKPAVLCCSTPPGKLKPRWQKRKTPFLAHHWLGVELIIFFSWKRSYLHNSLVSALVSVTVGPESQKAFQDQVSKHSNRNHDLYHPQVTGLQSVLGNT